MGRQILLLWVWAILIARVIHTEAYNYKARLINSDIYEDCENQPKNVVGLREVADLSQLHTEFNGDEVTLQGNITSNWHIQLTDRIEASADIYRFDRGSWIPTPYSLKNSNFCKIMYEKNDFWYDAWTKHVINRNEIMDKCFNEPGNTFVHEPFNVSLILRVPEPNLYGRYKVQIKIKAIDSLRQVRTPSICVEIKGDLELEE
ncbi:hypothetical protein KR222_009093 [Zaprionus bogoriensis]|nr:hypothetical protein KR222_009093 [Zaprionus bogoriensis]